jgi:hypothetical protein
VCVICTGFSFFLGQSLFLLTPKFTHDINCSSFLHLCTLVPFLKLLKCLYGMSVACAYSLCSS